MKILGIETSCDETAAAILEQNNGRITILSNIVASSAKLQSKFGGIIPEQAAREQLKVIIPVIEEAMLEAGCTKQDIDAIAVTYGPGLIGSLLVGVETAKVLSLIWNEQSSRASRPKPLIPVNHLIGHFYANWINQSSVLSSQLSDPSLSVISSSETGKQATGKLLSENRQQKTDNRAPSFPCIGLLVSGGHTDLVLFKNHGKYEYLGGTRDDAAGECFDKCARLLGLSYPGGPEISKLAKGGNPKAFKLPRPMIDSNDFDFSFSGLKTSVSNIVNRISETQNNKQDLCASIEAAIIDSLVKKTVKAAQVNKVEQIIVAGGVAANQKLISALKLEIRNLKLEIDLFVPPSYLCTDNAAMIAASAFFAKPIKNPHHLQANPNLSLEKDANHEIE